MESQLFGEAIILRRLTFNESDLLVYLYTQEKGLIKGVAKGAKKFKSKLGAHLEPISLISYLCITNKVFFKLVSANNLDYYIDIRDNLIKQNIAGLIFNYFIKIVKENQKDRDLYEHLKDWLNYFNQVEVEKASQADAYLLIFLAKFLKILGFAIEIKDCCLNSKLKKFSFSAGSFFCQKCRVNSAASHQLVISQEAFNLLVKLIKGEKNISFSETSIKQLKELLLKFLDYSHNLNEYEERKI